MGKGFKIYFHKCYAKNVTVKPVMRDHPIGSPKVVLYDSVFHQRL